MLVVVGYGFYLEHLLNQIASSPAARLVPQEFTAVAVPAKRRINLGYASVSLPRSIEGEPYDVDSSGFICVGATKPPFPITFCLPISEKDPDVHALITQFETLTGNRVEGFFAMEKRVVSQLPFSVWEIPKIGLTEAKIRATLLALKPALLSSSATSFSIFQLNGVGVLVVTSPGFCSVKIYDTKNGVSQEVLIDPKKVNLVEVVSALLGDYEYHLEGISREAIKGQIKDAKIPSIRSSEFVAPHPR